MKLPRILFACCLLAASACGLAAATPPSLLTAKQEASDWDALAFRIRDSKVYIGIAAVKLSVTELRSQDGELLGEYTIQVPMMRSKNDRGRIVLALEDNSVADLAKNGGVLRGKAYSDLEDKTPNGIICEIRPHEKQGILLAITTDDRTLNFTSNYTVIDRSM